MNSAPDFSAAGALPADFSDTAPEVEALPWYEEFTPKLAYLSDDERRTVDDAFVFAANAHAGQRRVSGEPYISHPIAVAAQVSEWHLDAQALAAALLHDVLEDSKVTYADIESRFGKSVADMVDGLSKLDKLEFESYAEAQAENFRKMLLAMSRDLRVILVKLADRRHNMLTLGAIRPEKRQRIARETLDIYAPIAHRLGLNKLCRELQNLAFAQTHPFRYRVIGKAVQAARGSRRELLQKIDDAVRAKLALAGIEAEVSSRQKTEFSIHRKMQEKHLSFSQVLDIFGLRVVVAEPATCYLALGALHSLYKPIPGKFKDYIAIPKVNGYQSLHTALIGPYGSPIEVQIRSRDMNRVAEHGVASHWLYKSGDESRDAIRFQTHKWLQSLLEMQQGDADSREFFEHVKVDLFPDEVYVFSPAGQIFELPRGATPVDFAYAVHTDIGHRCIAARINGTLAPLRSELCNGDRVEIVAAENASPNPAWLAYVRTGRARSKIRQFIKNRQQDEAAHLGERFLDQALRVFGGALSLIGEATWARFVQDVNAKSKADLLVDIGLGRRNPSLDARQLMVLGQFDVAAPKEALPLQVTGDEGTTLQFASCCHPIPGDPVIGLVSRGRGIVLHTHDCPQLASAGGGPDRRIDVEWDVPEERLFDVTVRCEVRNERGVLARVATAISEAGANIENVIMDDARRDSITSLQFTIQVHHRIHLAKVMRNIRRVSEVVRVARIRESR
ncbi:MAG TPA: bifunctional (p)ppGpp synthetase/guanosine-3',5'-bis(diphosphate) 3'-pyrophosphohydrolase [Rhodocyclaceae bacterium]